ncbi:unnamed protein product, partial [Oppiella nova]
MPSSVTSAPNNSRSREEGITAAVVGKYFAAIVPTMKCLFRPTKSRLEFATRVTPTYWNVYLKNQSLNLFLSSLGAKTPNSVIIPVINSLGVTSN